MVPRVAVLGGMVTFRRRSLKIRMTSYFSRGTNNTFDILQKNHFQLYTQLNKQVNTLLLFSFFNFYQISLFG
jgi:hypothetical protein